MKLAIMQPYIFPYLGYFQLINSVDKFVFYDDVHFIKGGWISRNKILSNNHTELSFTIPLSDISSFKEIKDTYVNKILYYKWRKKFIKTLNQNYSKAPFFREIMELIDKVLINEPKSISDLAINSIVEVVNYLDISVDFEKSSINYSTTKGLAREERIIEICRKNDVKTYINPLGGKDLYEKDFFRGKHIDLFFIHNKFEPYNQFSVNFVEGLSIIDVLMFNSIEVTKKMLNNYSLI